MIGYSTSTAMAKTLVTYMADDKAVRSAILSNFENAPDLRTIRILRAEHHARVARARKLATDGRNVGDDRPINFNNAKELSSIAAGSRKLRDAVLEFLANRQEAA